MNNFTVGYCYFSICGPTLGLKSTSISFDSSVFLNSIFGDPIIALRLYFTISSFLMYFYFLLLLVA